jgi:SAM-dependent methyltransferase
MNEFNLLQRYPSGKRNITKRAHTKTEEHIEISRKYGFEYFDGTREYGYGGYRYDGRWIQIAEDIVAYWNLKPGMRVLDIGCAKGFLVKDLLNICPGLEVFGLDVSEYALTHCEPEVVGRLHLGSMVKLPFPDKSFDAVICINTLHNLDRSDCMLAIKEIERISIGTKSYIQVDSYRTPEEREIFLDWVLTARTHEYPDGWRKLFQEAGYSGDYYWTLLLG